MFQLLSASMQTLLNGSWDSMGIAKLTVILRLAQMVERATCDQLANKVEADMQAVRKHALEIQHHAEKQES